jgi:hypothetical protein
MTATSKPTCSHPGCGQYGLVKVAYATWLCAQHIQERVNHPANVELTQAAQELDDYTDGGGKLN